MGARRHIHKEGVDHEEICQLGARCPCAGRYGRRGQDCPRGGLVSSGWAPAGFYYPVTIAGGFTTDIHVNDAQAIGSSLSTSHTGLITNSSFTNNTGNCRGTGAHSCPTTHWAFTLCSDNTFITGPIELDYRTNLSQQPTYSWTGNTTGYDSGRWTPSWGPVGNITGMCSDLAGAAWVAGGIWMYKYGP